MARSSSHDHDVEPVAPWPLTRDSLFTDAFVDYRPNLAILQYFETLASKSLVLYSSQIKSAYGFRDLLDQLIRGDTMSVSALERLLSLALLPDHLYEFNDCRIIPACMKLLEKYCLENRLLGGPYGYLCLRILVITLQVDVLLQHDELGEFVEDQCSVPAQDHLLALSENAANLLHSNLSTWSSDTPLKKMTFLKRGFTLEHAGFIYCKLGQQRRVLTSARVLYPERFYGWSILFYMILVLLRESGHFSCSNLNSDHECPRRVFQIITSRFWLAESLTEEEELLEEIYWSIYEPTDQRGTMLEGPKPFYGEDLFICKAYTLRIFPTAATESLDIQSVAALFKWIVSCSGHHTLPVMPAIFNACLLRMLKGCQDEDVLVWTLTEFMGLILGFAKTILSDENVPAYHVAHIAKVFLEIDLVSLIGRVLLLGADNVNSKHEYPFLDDDEANLSKYWFQVRSFLRTFITILLDRHKPARSLLLKSVPDWVKTARHVENAIGAHEHNSDLWRHLVECREEWLWLGEQLEIEDSWTDDLNECAYPRCPDPQPFCGTHIVCGRCNLARYCSPRCQQDHWYSYPPHIAEC